MNALQEKLDFLLDKYPTGKTVVIKDAEHAEVDGALAPLLPHRYERRFIELKKIVTGGTLRGVSVMRISRTVPKCHALAAELKREIDIASFVLSRRPLTGMAFENGNVLNAVLCFEDKIIVTIEIAATLKCGETPKDKHEVIAERGTACDVVVDAQLKQSSIYLFGDENESFTDVDFELYGLSIEECATVRAAYAVSAPSAMEEIAAADKLAELATEATLRSLTTHRRENI